MKATTTPQNSCFSVRLLSPSSNPLFTYYQPFVGGATALEGGGRNDAQTGTVAGGGIRLAGATSEVHVFDVFSGQWEKISPSGEMPSPRAAHAAAAVGSMVVIQVTPSFPPSDPNYPPGRNRTCWFSFR